AQVLDQERHAAERPRRKLAHRVAAGIVVALEDHGVQGRIVRLDARDRGLDQLLGGHRLLGYELREAQAVVVGIVGHSHDRHPMLAYRAPPAARKAIFATGARPGASRFRSANAASAASSAASMSASVIAAHMNMLCQGWT